MDITYQLFQVVFIADKFSFKRFHKKASTAIERFVDCLSITIRKMTEAHIYQLIQFFGLKFSRQVFDFDEQVIMIGH